MQGKTRTDEWYTPKHIIDCLNNAGAIFDLDPCTFQNPPYQIAKNTFDKDEDGLSKAWFGNVWCNPPYSKALIKSLLPNWCFMVTELPSYLTGWTTAFGTI